MSLNEEVSANFLKFSSKWKNDLKNTLQSLEAFESEYKSSYLRIASIQSWRTNVLPLEPLNESIGFFEEAQNDLLSGHIIASTGQWRYALKSLRSFIENSLSYLYFKDHLVELERWKLGNYKIGFSEILNYLNSHPRLAGFSSNLVGLASLKKEYGTLSRAVHASGSDFRMTNSGEVNQIFLFDRARLGKWKTREKECINAINLLYLYFYRDHLQGACLLEHRKTIGLSFPRKKAKEVKKIAGVNIIFP